MHNYTVPVYKIKLERVQDFPTKRPQLTNSDELAEFIKPYIKDKMQEEVVAIFLDIHYSVIGLQTIHIGRPFTCDFYLPSILTPTLLSGAVRLAVVHNHPMGDATDEITDDDEDVTLRLLTACNNLGITLCDHLIVDDSGNHESIISHIRQHAGSHGFKFDQGQES